MAEVTGDQADARTIAIDVQGGDQQDPEALVSWLRREPELGEALARGHLRIERTSARQERDGTTAGDQQPTMDGGASEVLLVVLGAASEPLFRDLYEVVRRAVTSWLRNRLGLGGPPVTAEPRVVDGTDRRRDGTPDGPDSTPQDDPQNAAQNDTQNAAQDDTQNAAQDDAAQTDTPDDDASPHRPGADEPPHRHHTDPPADGDQG